MPPWRNEAEMSVHQRPYVAIGESRCAEEKEAPVRGGKKGHRVGRKAKGRRIQKERKEVERDVEGDDRLYRVKPEQRKTAEESPFPERTGIGCPTIGTGGSSLLINLRHCGQSMDFFSSMAESRL